MIKKSILYNFILLTIFAIIGCSNFKGDMDWELSEFHMKDQNNKDFQLKDIKGEIWLVDFIFTSLCYILSSDDCKIWHKFKKW